MFGIENFWLFVVSGIALNLIPGPDSLYVMGRSATQGMKAGVVAGAGIGAGTLFHIFAAAFGLSALLATSAMAFTVVKIIGGLYLLYMAATMLLSKSSSSESGEKVELKKAPLKSIFLQGFLTNVLNPKVALFFLAFVPQFISAESDSKALAFLILGVVFNFNGMLWLLFLSWTSAKVSTKVQQSETIVRWTKRAAGTLFGYFGIKLMITSNAS
ncbi:putative Lysine/threonine efflux family protein [Vibrio nigripulchritudo MADA3029]|uniref:Putative Lysine/threonine efflux family protein n=1 Tax=Vibrio nigripulchritudo TaxID=28173 RepID=U4KAY1_9VIBR|nr:LysE family translocator [Vibrio nigripulchritudo]KJY73531.1 lysine transporter LysE [Vibrio nigripulchritudo]CCN37166.1 putative Lysine/threonine efflux family protein [Vibrio nigripulchritudo AM115]CCN41296.1 putative Lysine/threonine efflux family protein [Vibrio nigripulchritudo FTn2]CCN49575.1 putative Lysine/threonine efflux family protein [Vibrio nigripulchritudo MADA3020]CCN53691.1 putative Lysine/threonine efflux family protein [Vibrio nigripulchritudo MADA3021]